MGSTSSGDDNAAAPPADATNGAPASDGFAGASADLRCEIVTYAGRPDRCTLYPPATSGIERMSTWISADRHLLVDLDAVR